MPGPHRATGEERNRLPCAQVAIGSESRTARTTTGAVSSARQSPSTIHAPEDLPTFSRQLVRRLAPFYVCSTPVCSIAKELHSCYDKVDLDRNLHVTGGRAMWAALLYLVPLGIIIVANLGVARRSWRWLSFLCLGLLNALTFTIGLLSMSLPLLLRLTATSLSSDWQGPGFIGLGLGLTAVAVFGFACLATPLRRLIARWLPIDPDSPVHATALVFVVYLLAGSVGLLLSSGQLLGAAMESASIEPGTVILEQVVFTGFALSGVGLGVRRTLRQTLARLDLRAPTLRHLVMAAVMIAAFLALDYGTSLIWHRLWPTNYERVMQASQQMFARFASPFGALVLALSAGIGEETLFRGALQPRFRIPLTAAVFALGHVQYALSPAIVEILVIGLALGCLRERSNTTTCMAVHMGYNFLDVLIMPYFP